MGHVEESIKHSIRKNGFPEKAVKLPFKPIYDCCKQNNTALADVLGSLVKEGITGKIKGDFIEFRSPDNPEKSEARGAETGMPNMDRLQELLKTYQAGQPGTDIAGLQKMALEQITRMTPEQIAELRGLLGNLSDEDKKNILKMLGQQINPAR